MKSASLKVTPKDKLEVFKKGKDLLEKAITANKKNTEYRFLRLMIQENAPKILKYSSNINEDATWIKEHYSKCSAEIIQAIKNYAAQSVVLDL
jgi:1-aminocyclopropane-1-carboxylate deaminase/D-cysteine desulfhydrase-like pyridoxal-dependent ACC family enzyme